MFEPSLRIIEVTCDSDISPLVIDGKVSTRKKGDNNACACKLTFIAHYPAGATIFKFTLRYVNYPPPKGGELRVSTQETCCDQDRAQ